VDIETFARELSTLRHLPTSKPVQARALDPDAFFERFSEKVKREAPTGYAEKLVTTFRAFGLLPENSDGPEGRAFVDEHLAGFYDTSAHTVFVRSQAIGAIKGLGPLAERVVLAHEIEHAIQDQSFDLGDLTRLGDDESRLAANAVFEGDAMLVGIASAATSRGRPWQDVVAEAATLGAVNATHGLATSMSERPLALDGSLLIVRERMTFPYVSGLSFMSDLYRAGGFDLLDRTFAHLPTTTEQVLHVEKYIAGEQAIGVDPPKAPPGSSVVATGHFGELQTRMLLAQCLPIDEAARAAMGWGGDAYTVFKDASRTGLLWATAWDDESAAEAFSTAVAFRDSCKGAASFLVRREGTHVAVVRGFDEASAEPLFPAILASVGERPAASPPLGPVTLTKYIPSLLRWTVSGRRYDNAYLGIALEAPFGLENRIDRAGAAIAFEHLRPLAFAALSVAPTRVGTNASQNFVRDYARAIATKWGRAGARAMPLGESRRNLGIGTADWKEWMVGGTTVYFAIGLVPWCDRASLAIAVGGEGEGGKAAVEKWIKSLKKVGASSPTVCADVLF